MPSCATLFLSRIFTLLREWYTLGVLKKILILLGIIVAGAGIYYGRYYFIRQEIQEDIPAEMKTATRQVRAGNFTEIDFIHKGSGMAKILESENGHKLLRLENFEVTNGPDLYVYLSRSASPTGDIKDLGDYINLGRLKGNVGDQNYEIAADQNIDGYNTVVIWCKKFGALFSYAVMELNAD